jgi:hypothetical protein
LIGRIVAIVALVLVIAIVIRMRIVGAERSYAEGADHLAIATQMMTDLKNVVPNPSLDAKFFDTVQRTAEEANRQLDLVSSNAGDAKLLAQAAVMRGDLNFQMANLPVPAPTTQSSTQPAIVLRQSREEYLSAASSAYQEVIDKYGDQPLNVMSAHFGLAAIMENRSQWDEAAQHYKEVLLNQESGPGFKHFAQMRIMDLSTLNRPLLLRDSATPPLIPTTKPAKEDAAGASKASPSTVTTQATSKPVTTKPATTGATTAPK